jgi:hypothetical protein
MRWQVAGLWLALIAGCNNEETPGSTSTGGSGGSAKPGGAGGGFSADLAKELAASTGSGSAGAMKAGDGSAAKAGDGSAVAMAGDGSAKAGDGSAAKPGDGSAMKAGDGSAKAGDGSAAKPGDGSAGTMKAGDGSAAKPGDGSAKKAGDGSGAKPGDGSAAKPGDGGTKPGDGSAKAGSAASPKPPDPPPQISTGPGPVIQPAGTVPKRVAVPAELAAVKLSLLPNWDRDVMGAGTISLAVRIPNRADSAVFVFRYGYEDASAPAERDAYKKWLADKKILTLRQERQAGAAWFIEGTDGSGLPVFRVVVNWGGKKLVCFGSLYKDAESNKLGDLRDQTIIQAKQICETVAL